MNPVRVVSLPDLGDGLTLVFKASAFRKLYGDYGDNYFDVVLQKIPVFDFDVIEKCYLIAIHKDDAKAAPPIVPTVEEAIDNLTFEVVRDNILDAFTLSACGLDYKAFVDRQVEAMRDLEGKLLADPKKSPEDGSAASTGAGSGLDAPTLSSGT